MATSAYVGIPLDVNIKMSADLPVGGGHTVSIAVSPEDAAHVTINSGSGMSFDDSNWSVDQHCNVTIHDAGSYQLIVTITAPYHLATHSRTETVTVTGVALPLDTLIGSIYGLRDPSSGLQLLMGDAGVYHMSIGALDPAISFTRSSGAIHLHVTRPDSTTFYTASPVDCSSQAGRWKIDLIDDPWIVDTGAAAPSSTWQLFKNAVLMDTKAYNDRGFSYNFFARVGPPAIADSTYSHTFPIVVDSGSSGMSLGTAYYDGSGNLGTPGTSGASSAMSISIDSSLTNNGAYQNSFALWAADVKVGSTVIGNMRCRFDIFRF